MKNSKMDFYSAASSRPFIHSQISWKLVEILQLLELEQNTLPLMTWRAMAFVNTVMRESGRDPTDVSDVL